MVFLSDALAVQMLPNLKSLSIGTIINLVAGKVKNLFPDNFQYFNFELSDNSSFQLTQSINEVLKVVEKELLEGRRILIHCYKGISRAPAIGIAYLIRHKSMCFEDAFDHVKNKVGKADPNTGFLIQLSNLDSSSEGSLVSV